MSVVDTEPGTGPSTGPFVDELVTAAGRIHRPDVSAKFLVVETITRAFVHLDVAAWLVPNVDDRPWVLYNNFALYVDHAFEHGCVYATTTFEAVAVWFPRELPLPPIDDYDARLAKAVGEYLPRFQTFDRLLDDRHPGEPHHHLAFLAVVPERQHQGVGSALLAHHLAVLDLYGTSAYLEASDPHSRRLYARHRFTDLGPPIQLPDGGPRMWPMWRAPSPGTATPRGRAGSSQRSTNQRPDSRPNEPVRQRVGAG